MERGNNATPEGLLTLSSDPLMKMNN